MSLDSTLPGPHQRTASLPHPFAPEDALEPDMSALEEADMRLSSYDQFVGDLANMVQTLQSAVRLLSDRSPSGGEDMLMAETKRAIERARETFNAIRPPSPRI